MKYFIKQREGLRELDILAKAQIYDQVKLFPCILRRYLWKWMCSIIYSQSWCLFEDTGQIGVPVSYTWGKSLPYCQPQWAPETVWNLQCREKSLASVGGKTRLFGPPACSLVSSATALSPLLEFRVIFEFSVKYISVLAKCSVRIKTFSVNLASSGEDPISDLPNLLVSWFYRVAPWVVMERYATLIK